MRTRKTSGSIQSTSKDLKTRSRSTDDITPRPENLGGCWRKCQRQEKMNLSAQEDRKFTLPLTFYSICAFNRLMMPTQIGEGKPSLLVLNLFQKQFH
jgi:hypothetical protein